MGSNLENIPEIKGLCGTELARALAERAKRDQRTLFRDLRKVLIDNQCWPYGDEGAGTEGGAETTK